MNFTPSVNNTSGCKRFRGVQMCMIESPDNTPCILGDLSACSRVFMERLYEKGDN